MWILPLVGYLGSIVGFCFLTLAIGTPRMQRCLCPFPLLLFIHGLW